MPKKKTETKKTEVAKMNGREYTYESVDFAPLKKSAKPKHSEEKRDRKFCLSSYIDRNSLLYFLKRSEWIQHWAICTHDRDIKEDGTPKDEHTHILIYTYNAKTASAIKKAFDRYSNEIYRDTETEPQNTLAQICFDMPSQWRYLIHADDCEKAQYDANERFCDDFAYWNKLDISSGMNDSSDNLGLAMLKDYMDGVHPLEMAHRYGKEYIYHLSHFQKFAFEVFKADARNKVNTLNLRDMMSLCLESSPLSAENINTFWVVYDYIISQINTNYNSQIEFYLTENTNA